MTDDSGFFAGEIARSYAKANRELVASFIRYMESRGLSAPTIRSYRDSCQRLAETMGSRSVVDLARSDLRLFLTALLQKGLTDNSVRLHTAALRAFYKFIRLSGLTKHDPTLQLSRRKLPGRLPRVLTVSEIEALIAAAQDPFERLVPEFLYSTGLRISEALNLRIENIDFVQHIIFVKNGKGGKDRYVLFGSHAARAINEYLAWRPSKVFLFETPSRRGCISCKKTGWYGSFYVQRVQRHILIGNFAELPDEQVARQKFENIVDKIPDAHFSKKYLAKTPYRALALNSVLKRLAHRAGIGRVHAHSLRRAMACHMLSGGANIRAIQELLGHTNLTTTTIYTHLTAQDLKRIHDNCHPHAQEAPTDDEKE